MYTVYIWFWPTLLVCESMNNKNGLPTIEAAHKRRLQAQLVASEYTNKTKYAQHELTSRLSVSATTTSYILEPFDGKAVCPEQRRTDWLFNILTESSANVSDLPCIPPDLDLHGGTFSQTMPASLLILINLVTTQLISPPPCQAECTAINAATNPHHKMQRFTYWRCYLHPLLKMLFSPFIVDAICTLYWRCYSHPLS